MQDAPSGQKQKAEPVGPMMGIIIVVVVFVLGGIYFFFMQKEKLQTTPAVEEQVNS